MTTFKKLAALLIAGVMVTAMGSGVLATNHSNSSNRIVVKDALTGEETTLPIPGLANEITELPESNPFPSPFSVIGTDERVEMSPYEKRIVYVNATFPDGSITRGTGFLMANNLVVTAGHTLYDEAYGGYGSNVTVKVKTSESNVTTTAYYSKIIMSTGWVDNADHDQDFAFIELSTNLTVGYFGWRVEDSSLANTSANITGYPQSNGSKQMTMNGNILADTGLSLFYDIDTTVGQSGSPIRNSDGYVIGIHCFENGYSEHYGNHGVKFNREIGGIINEYR